MEKRRLVGNPFIKRKNRTWEVGIPTDPLSRPVSPPPIKRQNEDDNRAQNGQNELPKSESDESSPPSAAIQAGKAVVDDHLTYFTTKLSSHTKSPAVQPNLPIDQVVDLYKRNQYPGGHHFVIHQHDHPIAGVHYDLRLQISKTSSISFAIMYGLPGNANSKRLNRNATETRVHNLWVRFPFFNSLGLIY